MKKILSVLCIAGISLLVFAGCNSQDKIHNGDSVSIAYTAKFSDGKIFEENTKKNPLLFTVGQKQVINGLDEAVVGLKVGKKKKITIAPEKGYGELYNDNLVQKIGKLIFDKLEMNPEVGTVQQLDHLEGVIRGIETDTDGNEFVLFDINPKQTRDTLTYTIHILAKQTPSK